MKTSVGTIILQTRRQLLVFTFQLIIFGRIGLDMYFYLSESKIVNFLFLAVNRTFSIEVFKDRVRTVGNCII